MAGPILYVSPVPRWRWNRINRRRLLERRKKGFPQGYTIGSRNTVCIAQARSVQYGVDVISVTLLARSYLEIRYGYGTRLEHAARTLRNPGRPANTLWLTVCTEISAICVLMRPDGYYETRVALLEYDYSMPRPSLVRDGAAACSTC